MRDCSGAVFNQTERGNSMAKLPSGWIIIPRYKGLDLTHIEVELEERKLVTCKECKWSTFEGKMLICTATDTPHTYNWYCADGEANE